MTSALGTSRQAVASILTAENGVKALGYVPERIVPPLYIVTAGSPYVEAGDTFGTFRQRMSVEVVSQTSANDTNTERLDTMIEDALVALVNGGVNVESVSTPYGLDANNATYLAASIQINKTITL